MVWLDVEIFQNDNTFVHKFYNASGKPLKFCCCFPEEKRTVERNREYKQTALEKETDQGYTHWDQGYESSEEPCLYVGIPVTSLLYSSPNLLCPLKLQRCTDGSSLIYSNLYSYTENHRIIQAGLDFRSSYSHTKSQSI